MTSHRSAQALRRPLSIGVTIALAFSGVLASAPAFAQEAPSSENLQAPVVSTDDSAVDTTNEGTVDSTGDAVDAVDTTGEGAEGSEGNTDSPTSTPPSAAEVQELEAAGVELVGVGVNAAGETVVVTSGGEADSPAEQAAIEEFASTRGGSEEVVTIQLQGPVEAAASQDLVGGAGYISVNNITGDGGYCSLGFAAWSPEREPAFITAGHCKSGDEESIALATIPDTEPAVGGPGTVPSLDLPFIGTFGFSQFGGVGNTPGSDGDPNSIDIAVIDVDDTAGWTLKPEVTDWTTAGSTPSSLAESTTLVERVGVPQPGPLERSGRTTGHEFGTVREIDILDGWLMVSGYWVHGFSSTAVAIPGDSGGSVVQGTTAVGVVSGTAADVWGAPFLWSSLLTESLPATGGYEVALDIAAPTTSTTAAAMGGGIAVALPANATGLTATLNGQETAIVPVNGVATVPTPQAGVYDYTFTATNGMSQSAPTAATVTVAPPAPGVTSIAHGASFTEGATPTSVSGTGVEGATVEVALTTLAIAMPDVPGTEVSGTEVNNTANAPANSLQPDVTYTATVHNGTWSVDLEPLGAAVNGFTEMELAATQTVNGAASAATTLEFTVRGESRPMPPHVEPVKTLANTGGPSLAPLGLAASAALLLGALVLGAAAIRRKNQATH